MLERVLQYFSHNPLMYLWGKRRAELIKEKEMKIRLEHERKQWQKPDCLALQSALSYLESAETEDLYALLHDYRQLAIELRKLHKISGGFCLSDEPKFHPCNSVHLPDFIKEIFEEFDTDIGEQFCWRLCGGFSEDRDLRQLEYYWLELGFVDSSLTLYFRPGNKDWDLQIGYESQEEDYPLGKLGKQGKREILYDLVERKPILERWQFLEKLLRT
jgi:hypothetical protein